MASHFALRCFPRAEADTSCWVNKALQEGGDVRQGMSAQFRLEPDLAERIAIVPPELKHFLKEDATLRKWFEALNHSTRREIAGGSCRSRARKRATGERSRWPNACLR